MARYRVPVRGYVEVEVPGADGAMAQSVAEDWVRERLGVGWAVPSAGLGRDEDRESAVYCATHDDWHDDVFPCTGAATD